MMDIIHYPVLTRYCLECYELYDVVKESEVRMPHRLYGQMVKHLSCSKCGKAYNGPKIFEWEMGEY